MNQSKAIQVARGATGEELQLVRRAISGDSDALSLLFARNTKRLYKTTFALLRNREDAEDALQDGLFSAYLNLASFEGRSRFSTWLTRIVLNSALMHRRRSVAQGFRSLPENQAAELERLLAQAADTRPNPEKIYSMSETGQLVEKGLNQLSPALKSAFYLYDIRGMSTTEAAEAAGVRISAMKSRASRARHRLTNLLNIKDISF